VADRLGLIGENPRTACPMSSLASPGCRGVPPPTRGPVLSRNSAGPPRKGRPGVWNLGQLAHGERELG
jgi:hypothetical protein